MKTLTVATTLLVMMMFVPGIAMAQSYACPGGQQPILVQPTPQTQTQFVPQTVAPQPAPIVVQAPAQNTTDPVLLKILLGIQSQINNLQNQILLLKQAPPSLPPLPPPTNTTAPLPPPPPPSQGGSSCPNQQQEQGSSCPGGGQGPEGGGMPFYQGPGFQGGFPFSGGHHGGHRG